MAAGRACDLSVQDQSPPRQRRRLRIHRRGSEEAAPYRAPVALREQHPQHSLPGSDLSVAGACRRNHLRKGTRCRRRPRGLSGGALRRDPCPLQRPEGPARRARPPLRAIEPDIEGGRVRQRRRGRVRTEGEARARQEPDRGRADPRLRSHPADGGGGIRAQGESQGGREGCRQQGRRAEARQVRRRPEQHRARQQDEESALPDLLRRRQRTRLEPVQSVQPGAGGRDAPREVHGQRPVGRDVPLPCTRSFGSRTGR